MLTILAFSLTLLGQAAPAQNPAAQLVSKMLAYYSNAPTMTGTITLTASDGKGQVQVVTHLQYQRPSKLYIRQEKEGRDPLQWLTVSDGKLFSYDSPANLPGRQHRLIESVYQLIANEFTSDGSAVHRDYNVGEIYSVVAEASLGDRSVPLDIAIGRVEHLNHDVLTWMTVESGGKATLNGTDVNVINGKWREYGNQVSDPQYAPGTYEMLITDGGKLVRYTIKRKVGPKESGGVLLTEAWDVDLTVNGKPDPNLFRLPQ